MCGIIFAMNSDYYSLNLDDWVKDSLLASQVRGIHSAGMFQVDVDGELLWVKDGVSPTDFVKSQEASRMITMAPSSAITVGHVRAATVGNISQENAHPFIAERDDKTFVAVVHNGTLQNWRGHKDASKFDVDSQWLAHMLATEGHDAFEYFAGAFAIVWYDSAHPDHLFMARNKERPLYYMVANDDKTILGCSELGMLGWLSEKHGFSLTKEHSTPYFLEDGKIYKFSTKNIGTFSVVDYPKYVSRSYMSPSVPSTSYAQQNRYGAPWYGSNDDDLADYYDSKNWGDWGSYKRYDSKFEEEAQEELLAGVKRALRDARTTKLNLPVVVDTKPIDNIDAPPIEGDAPDFIDCGSVSLASVNVASAFYAEREAAKSLKVFGMVVRFSGILHDPATSEMIGTFNHFDNGEWAEQDAIMRFIPSSRAVKYMGEGGEPQLAAICGVSMGSGGDMVVLAELTTDQLEFVRDYEEAMRNPLKARVM